MKTPWLLSALLCVAVIDVSGVSAADTYAPPAASRDLLKNIDFSKATPLDENYRAEFKRCDEHNEFRGHKLVGWRRCSGDKNNVRAFLKLADGSIYFDSKLGLDLDGSWKAWNNKGKADQRATWYQWPRSCKKNKRDKSGLCQIEQVDAEHVPYIVIPIAGPKAAAREFREKTRVGKGDFGVVIFGNRWVPAFVADGGPYNKLGEASAATLRELGEDRCLHHNAQGYCDSYHNRSIDGSVVTIIFPGSRREGMTRANAVEWMCQAAKVKLGFTESALCRP